MFFFVFVFLNFDWYFPFLIERRTPKRFLGIGCSRRLLLLCSCRSRAIGAPGIWISASPPFLCANSNRKILPRSGVVVPGDWRRGAQWRASSSPSRGPRPRSCGTCGNSLFTSTSTGAPGTPSARRRLAILARLGCSYFVVQYWTRTSTLRVVFDLESSFGICSRYEKLTFIQI